MQSGKSSGRGLLLFLCCLVALLLTGCGSSSQPSHTKAPANEQVYRYGDVATDISTFDPAQGTDQPSLEAITMVFTGLVQMNDKLQVQPQLAQSYSVSPDGLAYTFHLRPDLHFSDDTPLTAYDVAYSIDRALSPAIANLNGVTLTYLGQLKGAAERVNGKIPTLLGTGIKIITPDTIELILDSKTAYFLQALTYPTSYVVEKKVIDRWGAKWTDHLSNNGGQGGAGPFKVRSYNHNTGIIFVPNALYYGPAPQLHTVNFIFYRTPESAFQAYQAGQVDLMKGVPPPQIPVAQALPYRQYVQSPALTIDYIAMNYLYKPFDNISIRQAFELALNKDVIASSIFNGTRIATCHIVPEGMPGYNPDLTCPDGAPTRGDAVKAKRLFQQGLQAEGLTLATFPPVLLTYESNNPTLSNAITTMRQQWQEVLNVNVDSHSEDFVQLLTDESKTLCATPNDLSRCRNKGLQMWAAAWGADYPDPQDWISLQFAQGAPNNQWNYGQNLSSAAPQQQQVQKQMLLTDVEQHSARRLASYNQIEQQLANDVAWLSLAQRKLSNVVKPYVAGQTFNPLGLTPPDDWSKISITIH
jgi:peptide/nickel transport system substrate-binding protein/oligopeptide transport system substrate-binding protein